MSLLFLAMFPGLDRDPWAWTWVGWAEGPTGQRRVQRHLGEPRVPAMARNSALREVVMDGFWVKMAFATHGRLAGASVAL